MAAPTKTVSSRALRALVLQGGGALGAYQAGVYERLAGSSYEPKWVAGVSIGAINAALIAGNAPTDRVKRLREFWNRVSSGWSLEAVPEWDYGRAAINRLSAAVHAMAGVPGFYSPRVPPPWLCSPGTSGALSLYSTDALRDTLNELVDFERVNGGEVRLSVGAVNVCTGNSQFFDSELMTIGVEHILASGALPPAFSPVEIDGEAYWDGGIVSNTPLQYVLDMRQGQRLLALSVDLFSAHGPLPVDLASVMSRHKDIMYSSRTRYNADMAATIANTRQAVRDALDKLPKALRDNAAVKALERSMQTTPADIVHLIYRLKPYEQDSRDYEFSRVSVNEHWTQGRQDMHDTLAHPEWLQRSGLDDGVTLYDLTRPVHAGSPS